MAVCSFRQLGLHPAGRGRRASKAIISMQWRWHRITSQVAAKECGSVPAFSMLAPTYTNKPYRNDTLCTLVQAADNKRQQPSMHGRQNQTPTARLSETSVLMAFIPHRKVAHVTSAAKPKFYTADANFQRFCSSNCFFGTQHKESSSNNPWAKAFQHLLELKTETQDGQRAFGTFTWKQHKSAKAPSYDSPHGRPKGAKIFCTAGSQCISLAIAKENHKSCFTFGGETTPEKRRS